MDSSSLPSKHLLPNNNSNLNYVTIQGGLVEGLEFHKFYFDQATVHNSISSSDSSRPSASAQLIASKPTVRSMGKSAVINFTRTIPSGEQFEETRVWQLFSGEWRMVHFHRGPAADANAKDS